MRKRLDLRGCPLIAENDRDVCNAQLPGGFEPQMTIDYLAITSDQTGDFESKFSDTAAHAIHSGVVFPGGSGIKHQLVDWPHLDIHWCLG